MNGEVIGVLIVISFLGVVIVWLEIRLLLHQREIKKLKRMLNIIPSDEVSQGQQKCQK